MSRILLVDDDEFVLKIYHKKLLDEGFEVNDAKDGLEAVKALQTVKIDLVVLDLMMPKLDGFEVLKYIRSRPDLKGTKVVVFSNFYVGAAERQTAASQADAALLKSSCTPSQLLETVKGLLEGAAPGKPGAGTGGVLGKAADAETQAKNRAEFMKNASEILATIRQLNEAFIKSDLPQTQAARLLEFYRKVHYLTAMAGMAGCSQIALLSSVFEALLFELHEQPNFINPSTLQTIAYTLDFFRLLLADAQSERPTEPVSAKTLVVDNDPVSLQALVGALRNSNLNPTGVQDPLVAVRMIEQDRFNLVILDIQMPGMNGFELCGRLRALPQYRRTPVLFVTGHADFESRIQSVSSGGNDLIAKPVFPIELSVKVVTHLLRSQLPEFWGLV